MTLAERVISFILRRNRYLLLALIVALLVLAGGLPNLQVSSSNRSFFGADNQEYLDLQEIEATYNLPTTILFMLVPPEDTAFDPDTLRSLREMTNDAWQIPYVLRVDSPINYMRSFADEDEVYVEPMLDEFAEITQGSADRFRELAINSDGLRNTLLSDDGRAYGISVRVVLPNGNRDARYEIESFVYELRASWEASNPDWDVHVSSGILGNNLLARVAVEDMIYLVPIAFAAVIILFLFAMGSVVLVGASVLVLLSSTLATFGFAGWTGIELTAGTAISPLAVMVLVSTSCVHIILTWVRAAETGKMDDPFRHSLTENLAPVTISHLTTAFGFLSLNFAPSPPLANMGNIVAFGLLFGHLSVFVILPAVLSRRVVSGAGRFMISGDRMRRFARWVIARRRVSLVLFPLLMIGAAFGISNIDFDDNVIRYFDSRYQLRQDSEAIQDQLTGLEALQYSFAAPEGASLFDPDFLRRVDRFAAWLEDQPYVAAVSSVTDIIKDLNQNMNGGAEEAAQIADSQSANAQLLMFYELSLPVGLDLNIMMDVDRTQTLVTATVRTEHSSQLRDLARQADGWLVENEPSIASRGSGIAIAFARISQRNNRQMIFGFLVVLGLVSVTMIATLRSLRYGLVSLVPNLVPALLAFGFWGIFLGDVNLGSTVVTTMTFGIVVDDTVHFLMHYLRCRRKKMNVTEALEDTFAVVGSAIVLTSVALILGFAIMSASGFAINQHIGILTSIVIFFALVSDLFLLPALLASIHGTRDDIEPS
jgi:uncharacterized protein